MNNTMDMDTQRNLAAILAFGILLVPVRILSAQASISALHFKGTHNSYASCTKTHNTCPIMHHHPQKQMDDFGVWVLELDFSIVCDGGSCGHPCAESLDCCPRAYVGHTGVCGDGCWTWWGPYLDDFLQKIRNARSFNYRPTFLMLDHKTWGEPWFNDPDHHERWRCVVQHELQSIFGDKLFGPADLLAHGGVWPNVPDLAGRVIVLSGSPGAGSDLVFGPDAPIGSGLADAYWDECTDVSAIQQAASQNKHFLRADQYQYDWTFAVPVPPNPLCVDASSPDHWVVRNDDQGIDQAVCDGDCWNVPWGCTPVEFTVHQQGTFRFPYDTILEAVDRAEFGWTVLIKPGNYPEALTISKPLTLEADGGVVTIGQ